MGKVAGSFYLIVLDGQTARFAAAMAHAAALYGASTALYAASSYVTGEGVVAHVSVHVWASDDGPVLDKCLTSLDLVFLSLHGCPHIFASPALPPN